MFVHVFDSVLLECNVAVTDFVKRLELFKGLGAI